MASKSLQVNFIVATGQQQNIWQLRFRLSLPILSYKLNMERYTQINFIKNEELFSNSHFLYITV